MVDYKFKKLAIEHVYKLHFQKQRNKKPKWLSNRH